MPRSGSGKSRVEAILMDIQAEHYSLLEMLDEVLEAAADDTKRDLADDSLYARAHHRVEMMRDLPDCQLRGHLNLLEKELEQAIALDLAHTAGDRVRKALAPIRDKVHSVSFRAHDLMEKLKGGHDAA